MKNRLIRHALMLIMAVMTNYSHAGSSQNGPVCPLDILLTNDDGWNAPGIQSMLDGLISAGHKVTLVAPAQQQSGRGSAINSSVGQRVSIEEHANDVWSVDGTPVDSVKAALGAILQRKPDLLISGANFGPNVGQQIALHSGTLGAALAAMHADIPAIAISVGIDPAERSTTPPFTSTLNAFDPVAGWLAQSIDRMGELNGCDQILGDKRGISINIPTPISRIVGVSEAMLSKHQLFEISWRRVEGRSAVIEYSVAGEDAKSDTDDVGLYLQGYITVTPLSGDLSQRSVVGFGESFMNAFDKRLPKISLTDPSAP